MACSEGRGWISVPHRAGQRDGQNICILQILPEHFTLKVSSRLPFIFNKPIVFPWICISTRTATKLSGSASFERKEKAPRPSVTCVWQVFPVSKRCHHIKSPEMTASFTDTLVFCFPLKINRKLLFLKKIKTQRHDRLNNLSVMIRSVWPSPRDTPGLEKSFSSMLSLSPHFPIYYLHFLLLKILPWSEIEPCKIIFAILS